MDVPAAVDMGMEKLEGSFSIVEYDPEVLKQFGLVSGNQVQVTLRGALVDDKTTTPMTISLRGMFTEVDMGNFKAGDLATLKCSIACRYYSLDIGGQKVIEIDVDNMVRNINGKDVLADIRSALGV
jgi:P2 family phage contractile tail tube protein